MGVTTAVVRGVGRIGGDQGVANVHRLNASQWGRQPDVRVRLLIGAFPRSRCQRTALDAAGGIHYLQVRVSAPEARQPGRFERHADGEVQPGGGELGHLLRRRGIVSYSESSFWTGPNIRPSPYGVSVPGPAIH